MSIFSTSALDHFKPYHRDSGTPAPSGRILGGCVARPRGLTPESASRVTRPAAASRGCGARPGSRGRPVGGGDPGGSSHPPTRPSAECASHQALPLCQLRELTQGVARPGSHTAQRAGATGGESPPVKPPIQVAPWRNASPAQLPHPRRDAGARPGSQTAQGGGAGDKGAEPPV